MSFTVCSICLSHEGLQSKAVLWLLQQKCEDKQRKPSLSPSQTHIFADMSPQIIGLTLNFAHRVSFLGSHLCSRIIQTSSDFPDLEWEGKVYGAARQKIVSLFWWRFHALQRDCGCGCHSLPHSEAFFIVPVSQQPKVTASSLSVL